MDKKERWKIDVSTSNIELKATKFIFEQAEKKLSDTIANAESISTKTTLLITLLSGLIIGISSYIFDNWGDKWDNGKMLIAILSIILIFSITMYALKNLLPTQYFTVGCMPEQLFDKIFFLEEYKKSNKSELYLYMNEIENYQYRIEINEEVNNRRWERFIISVYAILFAPILLLIIYCSMYIISLCCPCLNFF